MARLVLKVIKELEATVFVALFQPKIGSGNLEITTTAAEAVVIRANGHYTNE